MNQDYEARAGDRISKQDCDGETGACQVWARYLSNGNIAVVLYNAGESAHTVTVDFSSLGKQYAGKTFHVRDIWAHAVEAPATGSYAAKLAPHGSHTVIFSA